MAETVTNVAVLGSTGSIGRSTVEVIESLEPRLRAVGLSAHSNTRLLSQQATGLQPRWVAITDPAAADRVTRESLPRDTQLLVGPHSIEQAVAGDDIDVVVAGIVGSAGLRGTWAALAAGKTVALANKETLVMAGSLVTQLARDTGARLLPVDSEHSAVFQALQSGRREDVKRVVLTASGGPFRGYSPDQLARVTIAEALDHPTWDMGPKITVDSATMMNKALEVIEARWLFDLEPSQIEVVIHPQSVVHSMVEFVDGSVIAQLSPPDMKLPIQYALTFPERRPSPSPKIDWQSAMSLEFSPPDGELFPALGLGHEVAAAGGTAGAVLNAANEAAVAAFLEGSLEFTGIVAACRDVLNAHPFEPQPSLDRLIELDRWAREEVSRWALT